LVRGPSRSGLSPSPGYEGWWIVERRPGGELLRTWAATAPNLPDTDAALREAWQAAGFRDGDPPTFSPPPPSPPRPAPFVGERGL
jgi:hypothetical protein